MARWKERPDDSYRFAVQSFFEPTDFLRTLRDWILFYVEDGETRKSVLRQHQRRAVERIVERCAEPAKRRGLIWHTQGSGKTFTLLTAARMILERTERFGKPTVVVVVDRTELEGQLRKWVERLLGEMQQQDIPVWRAHSREALRDLLATDKRGLILSLIHKFQDLDRDANTRRGVYVFIDEAHRSVARDLGTYLMAALPAATIIGFTGTPIARTAYGQGTFKIFGAEDEQGYLHKYSIAESIADETTLPIRYALAPNDLTVPAEQLDREFLAAAGAEGVTDVEELNRVLDRAVHLRTFLTAGDRIRKVAGFVADLAHKTRRLVQESARQGGPGRLTAAVTFDARAVQALREAPGRYEAKVFNLVRGLRQEIDASPEAAPALFPIRERAERVLHELETRQTGGGAALDEIERLVVEREQMLRAAQRSGLAPRAFAVFWRLKDSFSLDDDAALAVAREAEALMAQFPNAAINQEEQRRLRAALYKPLLGLHRDERAQVVEHVLALLLQSADGGA